MLRTGVDLVEIERLRVAIERHGARLLQRVFTQAELQAAQGRAESLAARFAAKEAVAKALGTGIWRSGICWTDIEVTKEIATGAPQLALYGEAAARAGVLGLREWSISLSHDRERAVAFAVAIG
jgi:holo-[acyl-carrier protein] synthase